MKKLFLIFCLFFSFLSHSIENKTFVFFINGDWYYKGPQFEDSGIRLKDQANVLYRETLKRAKEDTKNNYVIFYDPKGKGSLFNRRWVKFRIFEKGKSRYSHLLKDAEIDTTTDEFIHLMSKTVKKKLGVLKKESSVFYYYGEHFPAHKEYRLDLSGGANSTYGLTKLLKLMRAFGGFQISIFHTCYLNALDFIGPMLSLSNEVVVPQKAILNTPLKMTGAFSENYLKDFTNRLIQDNSNHDRYQLLKYKKEAKDLYHRILELNQLVSPEYWEKMLNHFHSGDEAVLKDLSSQAFVLRDWSDAEEKEVFLPFYDYINLIDRYLLEGEHELDYIDQLIDQNPHLMDLFILLPEPLS